MQRRWLSLSVYAPARPARSVAAASILAGSLFTLVPTRAPAAPPAATAGQKVVGYRATSPMPLALPDGGRITTLNAIVRRTDSLPAGDTRGTCPAVVRTHTDASFTGGEYVVQAGFAEQEVAAAQFAVPASEFPLRIDLAEMIFATAGATVETTTHWSILFWSGNPETGQLIAEFSSDDVILPHLVLPPGNSGANIQVSVDPGDDQIFIPAPADGSNSFSVGYRIDQHNNQTQDPCLTAPPNESNAFPTTDNTGLDNPTGNWAFLVDGPFCICPSGWSRFSELGICQPSGDWVLRVTYTPTFCPGVGACCATNGTCTATTQASCTGNYLGDGSTCSPNPCPQPNGACCLEDGTCVDELTEPVCTANNGTYQGDNVQCSTVNCPQPTQACCFGSGPGTCLNETEADCLFIGGDPKGLGTQCLANDTCPLGACCMPDGSCQDTLSAVDCEAAGGMYQGDLSLCSGVSCPQPNGACCLTSGGCVVRTQAQCAIITGATWAGPFTDCADGNANGTADECESAGAPAATMTGVMSRKTCDLPLNLVGRVQNQDVTTEPRDGRIDHLRIAFNTAPGGPGAAPVTMLQQTGCPPGSQGAYAAYSGSSSMSASIAGNELVLTFTPGLENARTYKFLLSGPPLTSVTGQAFEVRGLRGDVNHDGRVNATDRSVVVSAWTGGGFSCVTDVDISGATNATDRSVVVSAWTGGTTTNCAP